MAHPAMLGQWPSTLPNTATATPCAGSSRRSRSGSGFPKPSTVMPRTTATEVLWPSMTERPWESFPPDATSPNPRRSTSWPSIRTCVGPVSAGVLWNGWWTICPPMAARCSPCTRWGRPSRTPPMPRPGPSTPGWVSFPWRSTRTSNGWAPRSSWSAPWRRLIRATLRTRTTPRGHQHHQPTGQAALGARCRGIDGAHAASVWGGAQGSAHAPTRIPGGVKAPHHGEKLR